MLEDVEGCWLRVEEQIAAIFGIADLILIDKPPALPVPCGKSRCAPRFNIPSTNDPQPSFVTLFPQKWWTGDLT